MNCWYVILSVSEESNPISADGRATGFFAALKMTYSVR